MKKIEASDKAIFIFFGVVISIIVALFGFFFFMNQGEETNTYAMSYGTTLEVDTEMTEVMVVTSDIDNTLPYIFVNDVIFTVKIKIYEDVSINPYISDRSFNYIFILELTEEQLHEIQTSEYVSFYVDRIPDEE